MSDNSKCPTPTVLAINQMAFEGHIIPHTWYDHITYMTEEGQVKVDLQAIVILSDIVYWYRPKRVMDESTGKLVRLERRFAADKLQRNYQQLSDQFGLSKTQVARAVKRLRDMGLITMEFRTVETTKGNIPNVLFLEPVPERLAEITYPLDERVRVSLQNCQDTPTNLPTYLDKNVRTNTENTSENTTKDKIIPPERKPDYLDAIVRFSGASPEDNWADPADAGGADDWAVAVDAFAGLVAVDPSTLPASTRREWSRMLREIGREWQAGPGLLAEIVGQVPESEFGWKTYASPHQAKADLGVLVGQHRNGGVRKAKRGKGNGRTSTLASIDAFREKLRARQAEADWVDAETYAVL